VNGLILELYHKCSHEAGWHAGFETSRNHGLVHIQNEDLLLVLLSQFNGFHHDLFLVILVVKFVGVVEFPAEFEKVQKFEIDQF
jgi:hypothetical protein